MPAAASQFTIAKPPGGVLQIPAVNNNASVNGAAPGQPKKLQARLKVVIRRLPPGLTQQEFDTALGEEWKLGKGKVDWIVYKSGKVSKDPAKPSRPSRCYLQVTAQSHLDPLAEHVRQITFLDAQNTANDPALIGPPSVELAPYGRVPSNKRRNDARQGLIDQDPEFIEFLESLTNPLPKPANIDAAVDGADKKDEPPTVSPLIQFLRDKKAAKEKAGASKSAKHARQGSKLENMDAKPDGKVGSKTTRGQTDAVEKKGGRFAKAERQGGKGQKKEPTVIQAKPKPAEPAAEKARPVKEPPAKKPEPAVRTAASIIQRDLGLKGRGGTASRRGGRQVKSASTDRDSAVTSEIAPPDAPGSATAVSAPERPEVATKPTAPKAEVNIPTGPASTRQPTIAKRQASPAATKVTSPAPSSAATNTKATAPSTSVATTNAKPNVSKPKPPPQPAASSTQAFLKHANASQGITEALLEEAMVTFGAVTKVEIDKRKGFAYVDFADNDGLCKAMAASPVKVAQGSVQVLERKDRPPSKASQGNAPASPAAANAGGTVASHASRGGYAGAGSRGGRGRGRGGIARGGGVAGTVASPTSSDVASTPASTIGTGQRENMTGKPAPPTSESTPSASRGDETVS